MDAKEGLENLIDALGIEDFTLQKDFGRERGDDYICHTHPIDLFSTYNYQVIITLIVDRLTKIVFPLMLLKFRLESITH